MLKALERVMLELAVVAVMLLALLIAADVTARTLLGRTIPDVIVLVRELMIPTIMLPLAAATAGRAHIAVTFLTDRLAPGPRGVAVILGWAFALLAILPLLYASWRDLSAAWTSSEFYDGQLGVPRWPMRAVFLAGLALMWVRLLAMLRSDLAQLRRTGAVTEAAHGAEEAV